MSTEKSKSRVKTAILGAVVLVFAVVGIITTVILTVSGAKSLLSNEKKKAEYERFILPLVMMDPAPFESADKTTNSVLLSASLWAIIVDNNLEKYEADEMGRTIVPDTDIEAQAVRLFGKDVKLTHESFGEGDMNITYDAEGKTYFVPAVGNVSLYTPKVEKIEKSKDTITLKVGYVAPGNSWMGDTDGKKYEPKPEKYMSYVLKRVDKKYYIYAVRDIDAATSGTDGTGHGGDTSQPSDSQGSQASGAAGGSEASSQTSENSSQAA